jgi:hypothetical protein
MYGVEQTATQATPTISFMPKNSKPPFVCLSLDGFLKLTMSQKREYLVAFKRYREGITDARAIRPTAAADRLSLTEKRELAAIG